MPRCIESVKPWTDWNGTVCGCPRHRLPFSAYSNRSHPGEAHLRKASGDLGTSGPPGGVLRRECNLLTAVKGFKVDLEASRT